MLRFLVPNTPTSPSPDLRRWPLVSLNPKSLPCIYIENPDNNLGRYYLPVRAERHRLGMEVFLKEIRMATAVTTPEVVTGPPPTQPVNLTPSAITKVKEIMATQDPFPAGLR